MRCLFFSVGMDGGSAFFRPTEGDRSNQLFLRLPAEVVDVETGEVYNAIGVGRTNQFMFFSMHLAVETAEVKFN